MKRIGLISLILVLALGALGVGYAAWTDTITISGTVSTGTLGWEFTNTAIQDPHQPTDPGGDYPTAYPDLSTSNGFVLVPNPNPPHNMTNYWELDKDVSWGEAQFGAPDNDGRFKTILFTLYNAYPSNFNGLTVYAWNYGTIPIIFDHARINGVKVAVNELVQMDVDNDGEMDFEIMWKDAYGYEIEPGLGSEEMSFWVHTLQPAPQLAQFTFTIELVAVQWHEYPLPPDWQP